MGKLFRKTLFGGFCKKDVIAYLENISAQNKSLQQSHAEELQAQNEQADALRQQLQEAEVQMQMLRQQIAQAEDHAAALRREADNAENRGAEARVRAKELEKQLMQMQMQSDEKATLEAQCQALQEELELRQQALEMQTDALAFQQAENEKLQTAYNALQQQRQEAQRVVMQEPHLEELLYLRREIERMRDSYDALMRQMWGYNWQREPAQSNPMNYRDLLDKMDRALNCLEQLVSCRECRADAPVSAETAAVGEPAESGKKDAPKKALALEEILRLVRNKK